MKLLITGANGFIGRSLLAALDCYDITIITRQNCDLTRTNEVDKFFSNKFFDVVLHAAIIGGNRLESDDASVLDQNLTMYYNLLANKSHFGKFINFDSGASVYHRNTPYGLSKHVIRQSVLDKVDFYNIKIFAAFGEKELARRYIKTNIKKYIDKAPIEIFQNKYMDFFYIDDLVNLVKYYLLTSAPPKEIDCTYPESSTLLDIAEIINVLSDYKVEINLHKKEMGEAYTGVFTELPLDFIGLNKGIDNVAKSLGMPKSVL